MSQVITLYRLQKIDSQRDKLHTRFTEVEREIKEDAILKEAQILHAQALAGQQGANEQERSTEEAVKSVQIKLEHNQSAQFGGKLQSPKELQDLQSEQTALERRRKELEEEQISAMLSLEQADLALKQAETNLSEAEQRSVSRLSLLRGEQISVQTELEKLNTERQAILASIPGSLVDSYEKLRTQKKGVAVTVISDESCAACGSSLTPGDCQAARSPTQIIHCPSCGRILYAG
jgi:predicted  nucleic acid-binding Zn-ribbon protein